MNSLRNVKLAGQKYYKRLNEAEEQEEAEDAQSGDYPPPSCDPRRQSNNIHVSRTDPDAKLSTKHGRPIALNYLLKLAWMYPLISYVAHSAYMQHKGLPMHAIYIGANY